VLQQAHAVAPPQDNAPIDPSIINRNAKPSNSTMCDKSNNGIALDGSCGYGCENCLTQCANYGYQYYCCYGNSCCCYSQAAACNTNVNCQTNNC